MKTSSFFTQSDIRFHSASKQIPLRERISLSQGVALAGEGYIAEGRLPQAPWQSPDPQQLEVLLHPPKWDASIPSNRNTVSLLQIPQELMEVFDFFGFTNAKDNQDARNMILAKQAEVSRLDQVINRFLQSLPQRRPNKRVLGIFALPPNRRSVALQKDTMIPLGLHFDNSLGLPLDDFEDKPNRICFNLGKEARYLWCVNRSLKSIWEEAAAEGKQIEDEKVLVQYFFSKYEDYPVTRLKLEPREAYIAPTDYVIHDGSTEGSEHPDVTFVIQGYFDPLVSENSSEQQGYIVA